MPKQLLLKVEIENHKTHYGPFCCLIRLVRISMHLNNTVKYGPHYDTSARFGPVHMGRSYLSF